MVESAGTRATWTYIIIIYIYIYWRKFAQGITTSARGKASIVENKHNTSYALTIQKLVSGTHGHGSTIEPPNEKASFRSRNATHMYTQREAHSSQSFKFTRKSAARWLDRAACRTSCGFSKGKQKPRNPRDKSKRPSAT